MQLRSYLSFWLNKCESFRSNGQCPPTVHLLRSFLIFPGLQPPSLPQSSPFVSIPKQCSFVTLIAVSWHFISTLVLLFILSISDWKAASAIISALGLRPTLAGVTLPDHYGRPR